ncbi:MAG: amidohydrolase family protein [Woeseiaceae bacterium]|nr:amidohydrolase family protein [Woeseiaceae bacterium]
MVTNSKNLAWYWVLLIAVASCGEESAPERADIIITGASIYMADEDQSWADALAIKNGQFIYVGDTGGLSAFISDTTIDLDGKLIIPGLTDGHSHPGYVNVENFGDVEGDTPEELLASVKAYADANPNQEWLRPCCWPTDMFVQGDAGPRKEVLDAVVPDRLVWFESATGHDYWLNSMALERLGVDKYTPDPRPGLAMYARDENGEPSGWLKEGAGVQHFAEHFALDDEARRELHKESVAETLQILSRHGVTSLFDAGNKGYGDLVYGVVSQLEQEGRLPVRYYGTYQIFTPERAMTAVSEVLRYREEYGGERLQFNSVKLFMDGITANQSAAFLQPYSSGTEGRTMLSADELRDLLLELHETKLDLMVHSIGDMSVRTVLDAVEAAKTAVEGDFYPRVTVAHLALIDPSDLRRIEELGVIANFTPWWMGVENSNVSRNLLGEERYEMTYQSRSVFDSGAVVSFSSDEWWGGEMLATYISPWLGMQVGHTRQYPREWWESEDDGVRGLVDERLDLEQLVKGYTNNGAYQLRREFDLGSIEVGKLADFVVLDNNFFVGDPYDIWQIRPSAVMMEGELIQGALSQ